MKTFTVGEKLTVKFFFCGKDVAQPAEVIAVNGDQITVDVKPFGWEVFSASELAEML
jgi:hypothetical protein